ncbi:hexose kinase [Liquorilactobacillus nagelii]|jgi:tagatose 6-phosphate kinase|uniref:hexose kinase n=1 Tax=Liquorilactobacillus nagelii TaxID=82688 RepID=UPI00242B7CD7|nr:hexose kinase [Liquorilactobacillus nagelii]MCI1700797.1 hexose kinase [Liquorilactobacillus nagelii]
MILTVTMNPSIDMAYDLSQLKLDQVNRAANVQKTAGGKGLNVTRVINQMGQPVIATGLLGGRFGQFINDKLIEEKIAASFTEIAGETRNSIALLHDGGKQTEVLERGPQIALRERQNFLSDFKELLNKVDLVTISGSLPQGLEEDFYSHLIEIAAENNVAVLLDTSGRSLKNALGSTCQPLLIKPNAAELGDLVNQKISDNDITEVVAALKDPLLAKLKWISTSLGSNGAVVKFENKLYRAEIPRVAAISPVGSGDASLAGLAIGISLGKTPIDTIKTSMTLGILNALEAATGWVNPSKFTEYFEQVKVTEIN